MDTEEVAGGVLMEYVIQDTELSGLPISPETAFTTPKGLYSAKIERRQRAMIADYEPALMHFLESREEILLAMRGGSPMTLFERIMGGWITFFLKRCVLVVTNRRILHFPSTRNFSPRYAVAQLRYCDVESITAPSLLGRRFTVRYKNGKKETFRAINEKKKMKAIIPELQLEGEDPTLFRARHHLCPNCAAPLEAAVAPCVKCGTAFKGMTAAIFLSILLPGGGYFYTRHPIVGVVIALSEIVLLALCVLSLMGMVFAPEDPSMRLLLPIAIGVSFLVVKIIAVFQARSLVKEYLPRDRSVQSMKDTWEPN